MEILNDWFVLKERGLEHLLPFEDYFNKRRRYVLYNDKLYDATELNVIRQLKLHGFNPNFEIDYVTQFHKYVEGNEIWNGDLLIFDLPIITLGNLKEIKCGLWLESNKTLKSLDKLEKINWSLDLQNSELNDLGELKHIEINIWLENSKLDNIGKLEYVGRNWHDDTKNLKSLYEQRKKFGKIWKIKNFILHLIKIK